MSEETTRIRVHIVGIVVVALFGALLARLWVLQVATSPEQAEAIVEANTTKEIQNESTRGRIFDRKGRLLVGNQAEWAIYVDPDVQRDEETKDITVRSLARVLRNAPAPIGASEIIERIDDPRQDPADDLLVAHGPDEVSDEVRLQILEHQEDYPLVKVRMRTDRVYPVLYSDPLTGTEVPVAAHVLGYVGKVTGVDEAQRLRGYEDRDTIGRAGIEAAMESQLRGVPERDLVLLDPSRSRVGEPKVLDPGRPGHDVYLTLDLDVQLAAETALRDAIRQARTFQYKYEGDAEPKPFKAPAGAVVVMDVTNGDVLAMASYPSYPVQRFVGGISTEEYEALQADPAKPSINRATSGEYATGSTFKVFTALAAMNYGRLDPYRFVDDPDGFIEIGENDLYQRFRNAGSQPCGSTDLVISLATSCDTYYYLIGLDFWRIWDNGTPTTGRKNVRVGYGLQHVAREFGFDEKTGVEIGELDGAVPDKKWKAAIANAIYGEGSRLANENDEWTSGDNINFSVGQGGFSATPLQLANAYAALANGGTLHQPRLVRRIDSVDGKIIAMPRPKPVRRIPLDPNQRELIVEGLRQVVTDPSGTAFETFRPSPATGLEVAGKTGTAQVEGKADTSLFAAFFPASAPKYAVIAVVEEAGRGARVAAPIVRSVIEQLAFGRVLTPIALGPEPSVGGER